MFKKFIFGFVILFIHYSFSNTLPTEVIKEIEVLIPHGSKQTSVIKITPKVEYHINLSAPVNISMDDPKLLEVLTYYNGKIEVIIKDMISNRIEQQMILARSFIGSPVMSVSSNEIKVLSKYYFYPIVLMNNHASKEKSVKLLCGMQYQAIIVKKEKIQ